jgi:hypothetical protein
MTKGGDYFILHETGHVANACAEGINHCVCHTCCCDPGLPRNNVVSSFGEDFEMPSAIGCSVRQRPTLSDSVH